MKKVLVITYYWPPAGGSGVQRWLKFCKYLHEFGWQPIVYTPEAPDLDLLDPTLEHDVRADQPVVRRPILEPRRLLRRLGGRSKDNEGTSLDEIVFVDDADRSWRQKVLVWMRSNLAIPDARRLWVRPSVTFLREYLARHPVDAIASTGPPQSMHLIAKGVKNRSGLPWLADFRDPWTGIVYFDRLPLTWLAKERHKRLERSVLTSADAVTSVSWILSRNLERLGAAKVDTITNGFDDDDVEGSGNGAEPDPGFVLGHVGFLTGDRVPHALWQGLAELRDERTGFAGDLQIRFVGRVDASVVESARRRGIEIDLVGYVPHEEAIAHMQRSRVLLLIISEKDPGVVTGKLFEYLAAGRPILLLGPPHGDAAKIVAESGAGQVVAPNDPAAIKSALSEMYERFRAGSLNVDPQGVEQFSRRNLTAKLSAVLDRIAGNADT